MDDPFTFMAIDPGLIAGWAYYEGEYLDKSGTTNGDSVENIKELLIELDPDMVLIEDQYPGRMGWKSTKTLLFRKHLWEIPALLYDMDVISVAPKTWQSFYKIQRGNKKNKQLKGDMILLAHKLLKQKDITLDSIRENQADAILMGEWCIDSKVLKQYMEQR